MEDCLSNRLLCMSMIYPQDTYNKHTALICVGVSNTGVPRRQYITSSPKVGMSHIEIFPHVAYISCA
jgi:hypothetical protein